MNNYDVEVPERHVTTYKVQASSAKEARRKVRRHIESGDTDLLDSSTEVSHPMMRARWRVFSIGNDGCTKECL